MNSPVGCSPVPVRAQGMGGEMTKWRKARVYLDTSVISYLEQWDAPGKMEITRKLWDFIRKGDFEIVISNVVLKEISMCDTGKYRMLIEHLDEIQYELVTTNDETDALADKFIELGILRRKNIDDCQHLAAAMYSKCDIVASWNMKHIASWATQAGVRHIAGLTGYKELYVATPEMMLEAENGDEMPTFE